MHPIVYTNHVAVIMCITTASTTYEPYLYKPKHGRLSLRAMARGLY